MGLSQAALSCGTANLHYNRDIPWAEKTKIMKLAHTKLLALAFALTIDCIALPQSLGCFAREPGDKGGQSAASSQQNSSIGFANSQFLKLKAYCEKTRKLIMSNRYQQVVKEADAAIRDFPGQAMPYYFRGVAYTELNEAKAGLADLERFERMQKVAKIPVEGYTYDCKARNFAELGQWSRALLEVEQAQKTGQSLERFKLKGQILRNLGREEEAAQQFIKALKIDPKHYWSAYELARSYENRKMYDKAVESASQMIKIRPSEPYAYGYRAKLFKKMGKAEEALKDEQSAKQMAQAEFPF